MPSWGWALTVLTAGQVLGATLVPVLPEEAYHWNFARHLDWSYYDHPPMLAWSIALGRLCFGDTAIGIRLVPLIFSLGTALLMARMARRFYGERAALTVILLLALEPTMIVVPTWGFPDSPLLFFWALTLTLVWQALATQRAAWWIAAGAALGAGMLSKYTAAFLVPSVIAYLLCSKRDRFWLGTPWPYLAVLVSLIVFTPVIYWNWIHDWVSFRFQSVNRFQAADSVSVLRGLNFIAEQWLGVVPLTLSVGVIALWRGFRSARNEDRFLFWSFTPMMGFFFVLGWTPSYHWLWPLPAYFALTIAMAGVLVDSQSRLASYWATWRWRIEGLAGLLVLLALVHATLILPLVPPLREMYGWDAVAKRAVALHASQPAGSFYLGVGGRPYPCPSQLAFHLNAPASVYGNNLIGLPSLQYIFWGEPPNKLAGRDAAIVFEGDDESGSLRRILAEHFVSLEPAETLDVRISRIPFSTSRRVQFMLIRGHRYESPAH